MSIAHFESPSLNLSQSIVDRGTHIFKRCIIAIEGEHRCNQGKSYAMPPEFIAKLGDNLNAEIGNGREIGFFSGLEGKAHHKSADTKFATLEGFVDCRPVTEADLPNPHARGMLGKMALFGVSKIFSKLDQVRSGAIKALSPGIDMQRGLIFEVSAVPVASMPGVAFFSFNDVMAERSQVAQLRDRAIEGVDGWIESLRMLERSEGELTSSITAKQQSFDQFIDYMAELFQIPASVGGIEYAKNPYEREVVKGAFSYPENKVTSEPPAVDNANPVTASTPPTSDVPPRYSQPRSPNSMKRSRRNGSFDLSLQAAS